MRETLKIKKWQLVRRKTELATDDLSGEDFVAVGKRAFRKQRQLEQVILPPSVTAIKTEAFCGCQQLKRVIPTGETGLGIGGSAFENCTALTEIKHFSKISRIGARAFAGCASITDLNFGRSLYWLGEECCYGCSSLMQLRLPFCRDGIGKAAFADCQKLEHVEMDPALPALATNLFRGCSALHRIEFSPLLERIDKGAFRGCVSLTEITLPASIKRIGSRAFYGCTGRKCTTLELGIVRIGSFAFAKNPALCKITLPHSLKHLGFGAFGLGFRREKIRLLVDNEYMLRRLKPRLFLCGSAGCAELILVGKTIEERKRERRRASVEQNPTHLIDE